MEGLMPGKIFDSIFNLLDSSKNGRVSKTEMLSYFIKLSSAESNAPKDRKISSGERRREIELTGKS
jgi:hypothetical protein